MAQQKGMKRAVKVAARKRKLVAKAKLAVQKRIVRKAQMPAEEKTAE